MFIFLSVEHYIILFAVVISDQLGCDHYILWFDLHHIMTRSAKLTHFVTCFKKSAVAINLRVSNFMKIYLTILI